MNKQFTLEQLQKLSYLDQPGGSSKTLTQAYQSAATLLGFEGQANPEAVRIMRAFFLDFFAARLSLMYFQHEKNPEIMKLLDHICVLLEIRPASGMANTPADDHAGLKNFIKKSKDGGFL